MKKLISLSIVIIVLFTFTLSSIGKIDRLYGHWAQELIDEEFIHEYFNYLNENFNPDSTITIGEYYKSIGKLLHQYGYTVDLVGLDEVLKRKDMAVIIGRILIDKNIIKASHNNIPFIDMGNAKKDEVAIISALYSNHIIKGNTNNTFSPERESTQAEAIVLLKRVKGVLETMKEKSIPFNVKSIEQVYSSTYNELTVKEVEDKVEITILETFPTPGYTIEVERVIEGANGEYEIYLNERPPKKDSDLLQVITYKVIVIEIDKSYLKEKPYKFNVVKHFILNPKVNQLYK